MAHRVTLTLMFVFMSAGHGFTHEPGNLQDRQRAYDLVACGELAEEAGLPDAGVLRRAGLQALETLTRAEDAERGHDFPPSYNNDQRRAFIAGKVYAQWHSEVMSSLYDEQFLPYPLNSGDQYEVRYREWKEDRQVAAFKLHQRDCRTILQ